MGTNYRPEQQALGEKMKGFKSSVYRLAYFFKKSRDQWKDRALEKQGRIKALMVKIRDLSDSREKWKQKAKELDQRLNETLADKSISKDEEIQKLLPVIEETALQTPFGHTYPIYIIQISIQLFIHSLTSLRGSQKTFEIFSQIIDISVPSFNSIRMWIYRVGLYELQREHEFRSDWIFILDHSIELGQVKCLVILGVTMKQLRNSGYKLKHQDVEVLDIEVMEHSTGDMINNKLISLSKRVGVPVQILSDHGSDLKNGIEKYSEENSNVIYIYDITHKMASLLKKELGNEESYNEFANHISTSLKQIQQTELYFLIPPKQRVKARYLNIDKYVNWALGILHYQKQGDFSQISKADKNNTEKLKNKINNALGQLSVLEVKSNIDMSKNQIIQRIKQEVYEQLKMRTAQLSDRGKKRFIEKLGWLSDYEEKINTWAEIVYLIHLVEKQVKCEGLSQESKKIFEENSKEIGLNNKRVQNFKKQIIDFLSEEGAKIPDEQSFLGTSDIIESTFGKYKYFSSRNPLKEVGKMILTIPVFIGKKTGKYIKTALENVTSDSLEEWAKDTFGQSNLSKRRQAFNPKLMT